jgi:hypothetical protein
MPEAAKVHPVRFIVCSFVRSEADGVEIGKDVSYSDDT